MRIGRKNRAKVLKTCLLLKKEAYVKLNSRVLATVISVFKSKQNYLQQGFGKLP
jgi:hypothetical protein